MKLFTRQLQIGSAYNYYSIQADKGAETIVSGITRKLAGHIIGYMDQHVSNFCRLNQLATLLRDLQHIRPLLEKTKFSQVEDCNAILRVIAWIDKHAGNPIDGELCAYLSLDNEQWDKQKGH